METRHFMKTLCKQKVKTFFLSTLIALNVKWVPRLRKPQPNFQYYVKKVEAQAKEWFPYKKACVKFIW